MRASNPKLTRRVRLMGIVGAVKQLGVLQVLCVIQNVKLAAYGYVNKVFFCQESGLRNHFATKGSRPTGDILLGKIGANMEPLVKWGPAITDSQQD